MKAYDKKILIDAITWQWGYSRKKAESYIKNASEAMKQALLEGYRKQVVKLFYED